MENEGPRVHTLLGFVLMFWGGCGDIVKIDLLLAQELNSAGRMGVIKLTFFVFLGCVVSRAFSKHIFKIFDVLGLCLWLQSRFPGFSFWGQFSK